MLIKTFPLDLWHGMKFVVVWFRLQMIDLNELRSSDRTAWEGRLFHCTTAKGKKVLGLRRGVGGFHRLVIFSTQSRHAVNFA